MEVINDTINFLKSLSFVDIVFFFAVLVLMLLIITLIYFILENKDDEYQDINISKSSKEDKLALEDLKQITEALEEAPENTINLNDYEEEQEQKAIISYEELLKHKDDFALNYLEEENVDDELTIKKIDLDNLVNKDITVKPNLNVTVISYEKEEAFLEALKTLQQNLN